MISASGEPMGAHSLIQLSLQQKRQATMLYHWMSLDYLEGLLVLLESARCGVRDTSSNWSTHVFPALEDFKQSTLKLISWRAFDGYCGTGADQCGRMISEHSSMWMTSDEEERFNQQWEAVYGYADRIDAAAGAGGQRRLTDFSMVMAWQEHAHLWKQLPKYRVRTDVEGMSGKKPPRTGVYVPQDDPHGTLQFAWTGNEDGVLSDARTFNDLGRRLISEVGRDALWVDDAKLIPFALREMERNPRMDTGMNNLERVRARPSRARGAMAAAVFTERPCKWYFVEMALGEFEEMVEPAALNEPLRLRCEAGQPCPREGWWLTPAGTGRSHFKLGDIMPPLGTDYGLTIWQWDEHQR